MSIYIYIYVFVLVLGLILGVAACGLWFAACSLRLAACGLQFVICCLRPVSGGGPPYTVPLPGEGLDPVTHRQVSKWYSNIKWRLSWSQSHLKNPTKQHPNNDARKHPRIRPKILRTLRRWLPFWIHERSTSRLMNNFVCDLLFGTSGWVPQSTDLGIPLGTLSPIFLT